MFIFKIDYGDEENSFRALRAKRLLNAICEASRVVD